MDLLLLLARLALFGIFGVAGIAKLVDRDGSRRALEGFGVPASIAAPGAILLPVAEIVVALLMLPRATAGTVGAIGALGLLLAFVGGIAYNMSKGNTPDCHCFGQIHSEPAGWKTLIRNAVFAAIAVFLLVVGWNDPGYSLVGWIGNLSTVEIVATVIAVIALSLLALEGWLLFHLLGQNGRLLVRLDNLEQALTDLAAEYDEDGEPIVRHEVQPATPPAGLPVGSAAPSFTASGLFGETTTLDALRAIGKPVVLIFSDTGCGPCNVLMPEVATWQKDHAARLTIAVISRGDLESNKKKSAEQKLTNVFVQKNREIAEPYKALGTPSAVTVRPDGTIGSPLSPGADAIRKLVERETGTLRLNAAAPAAAPRANGARNQPKAPASQVGQDAPAIELNDLDGRPVSLSTFAGQQTAILFWNPGCGYCKRMVDDLKAWESNKPANAPELLIVSTGEADANRAHGFNSTLVLDQGFKTGNSFGASGTPSAVLVDADGKIASGVLVGSPNVMAALNGEDVTDLSAAPSGPKGIEIGKPAAAVKLPDLDGKEFDLATPVKKSRLLVFWNPGCGYCKRMVEDLRLVESSDQKNRPELIIVSTGSVEENKAQGFASTILLDQGFAVGRAFGAGGTPSAVLIDAKGNVASDLAVGAPGVLELANRKMK